MKIGLNNPQNYAAIGCLSAGAVNRGGIAMTPERRARMIMTYGTEDVSTCLLYTSGKSAP